MKEKELRGAVVDILVDVAMGEWAMPELTFPVIAGGFWAGFDLSPYTGHFRLADNLTLRLEVPRDDRFGPLFEAMSVRNKSATLNLVDSSRLDAELVHMRRLGAHAEIDLHHWHWSGTVVPSLWVGRLNGYVPTGGNARISDRNGSRTGWYLEGSYNWCLIKSEHADFHAVVVDTGGMAIERETLIRDMLAMQFTFGGPLEVGHLVGIDDGRQCVGAIGVEHLVRLGGKHRSPVPDFVLEASDWIPPFFRSVAHRLRDEGLEPLIIAITAYLDAESDHLDGGYLKAHVGLEAFAKRLVASGKHDVIVKDKCAWRKWVRTLRPLIETHLIDPERNADVVFGKFMSAMNAPSGDIVRRAFAAIPIELPQEVTEEIEKRNYPVHRFLMNSKLEHDIDRDARRLEMIQTLLVALVALHVGYGGRIRGYDVAADGGRPSPDWWPATAGPEEVQFVAERHR